MSHFVWALPTLTLLAALGLMACSRKEPSRYVLPAARTIAVLAVATAYAVALFHPAVPR
ncbi:hypothetical protein OG530_19205 [Streptomyces decoyicus]|uniref:hypothetical protein n=1 Tax=Streptomyces decoyicus TaxID=249567 RepID=UPI002E19A8E9